MISKLDRMWPLNVTNSSRVCLSDEPDEYAERLRRISQVTEFPVLFINIGICDEFDFRRLHIRRSSLPPWYSSPPLSSSSIAGTGTNGGMSLLKTVKLSDWFGK